MVDSIQSLMQALVGGALWSIFGAIVVFAFIYSAILFLSASGDATKIQKAKSSFLWGVVGVAVGILAYSIINIVGDILK